MNSKILLLAFAAAAISSCTTAYKTGQTPDDVYYSPARPQDEYVQVQRERDDNRQYRNSDDYYDDRYLRMKVHNRTRWSDLDDWYYYDNRYNYTAYNDWNNPWSPSGYWNYCYNPYYGYSHGVINYSRVKNVYSAPRTFNLNTYNSNSLTNNNYTNAKAPRTGPSTYNSSRNVYNTNSSSNRSNPGSFLRNIFNNGSSSSSSNSTNTNSSSTTPRSSSTSSSSSSSSGGSSGSTAPVRRF